MTEDVMKSMGELKTAFEGFKEKQENVTKQSVKDALDEHKLSELKEQVIGAVKEVQELHLKNEQLEKAINTPAAGSDEKGNKPASEHHKAFMQYLKKGTEINLEQKDMSVISDPDGGYLVTPEMGQIIQTRFFETSPMRNYANVITISTDSYEQPVDNDEMSAGWVGETESSPTTNTATIDNIIIPTHESYAKPRATQKLIDDAAVNLESWIANKVADKLSRLENAAFVNGDGVKKPKGFLQQLTTSTSYSANAIQTINSGDANTFTYSGIKALMTNLKQPYHTRAIFAAARDGLDKLMDVVDGDSRPIFNLDFSQDPMEIATMLGKPFVLFEDMPSVSAGTRPLAFGDFNSCYTIVDRTGVRILRDPYSAKPYVEFYTTKRTGGGVVNFEAVKVQNISA